jgi:hypothetical protein
VHVQLDLRISHVAILHHPAAGVLRLLPALRNQPQAGPHLTRMTETTNARAHRGRLRGTILACAAAMSVGGTLLLAGCSNGGAASSPSGIDANGPVRAAAGAPAAAAGLAPAPSPAASGNGQAASQTGSLIPAQSIIYTASLTVQADDVPSAAQRAAGIVAGAGGYTAGEQESSQPGQRLVSAATLQLKIPAAAYPATLGRLRTELGTPTSLSQQAQDVTQQVADVTSRVTSAQAAITQLRALLKRAGSVSDLLAVQDQINSQESDLEALQAQQRALAHATTYATVSLLLVSHHRISVMKKKGRGFGTGLSAGWRGLRQATAWLLTAIGTVLPFAVIVTVAGGIGYLVRRRMLRRRSRPTAAG